jgi:hypothetical protein
MASRTLNRQSDHDNAVHAAARIYTDRGKFAWVNPNGEKNKSWSGRYIDVIAVENRNADRAWVIEVETDDSVSDAEASSQWEDYAKAYNSHWYLAVPVDSKRDAERLLQKYRITNCTVLTWQRNQNGTHTFWGLPGV